MIKILLIEDDAQHTLLVKIRLKAEGFEVTAAQTGAEGVAAALKQTPDLILMDLMLPDVSPDELISGLRAVTTAQKIPIIAFTALDSYEIHRRHLDAEIAGLIPKPYETKDFLATIKKFTAK